MGEEAIIGIYQDASGCQASHQGLKQLFHDATYMCHWSAGAGREIIDITSDLTMMTAIEILSDHGYYRIRQHLMPQCLLAV